MPSKKKIAMRPDGAPAIPLYAEVSLDNKSQHHCLVLDKHGQWFVFPSPSHVHIVTDGIKEKWVNFDRFADADSERIIELHQEVFKTLPPKQDLVITALITWKALCARANQRLERPKKIDEETGAPVGKKLANRRYVLVTDEWSSITVPQTRACLRILKGCVTKGADGLWTCSEEELKAAVYERVAELHTRQDGWRIFQYYRPRLIEAKIIRLV
jgi:hypothetical protein